MQTIDREQLHKLQQEHDDLKIVEVLGPDSYKEGHLPGAVNVPLDEGFASHIHEAVPNEDSPVVVYCSNTECPASDKAARNMEAMGYSQVYDYKAGKEDWQNAGEPVDSGA